MCGSVCVLAHVTDSDCIVAAPLSGNAPRDHQTHQTSHAWWPHCSHDLWCGQDANPPLDGCDLPRNHSPCSCCNFSHVICLSCIPYDLCHYSMLQTFTVACCSLQPLKIGASGSSKNSTLLIFWMINPAQTWDYQDPSWVPLKWQGQTAFEPEVLMTMMWRRWKSLVLRKDLGHPHS